MTTVDAPGDGAPGTTRALDLHPPGAVRWIVEKLEEAGHEAWAVGGAIRDALAGRPSGDWDITTAARPRQVRKLFPRTVPIGMDHGTVGILARDGILYEVTTFRRDVETTGRHAVVEFADGVEEDLARRDFTINAVAWHPLRKELHDPFGGASDLAQGVLRTVGNPTERFQEDFLRVLRALRFAGTFALRVEPATWDALVAQAAGIRTLSAERIREELEKILSGVQPPSRALSLYACAGCRDRVLRELAGSEGVTRRPEAGDDPGPEEHPATSIQGTLRDDVWSHALRAVDLLPPNRTDLRLAALLRASAFIPEDRIQEDPAPSGASLQRRGALRAAAALERLRFSNAWIRQVAEGVEASLRPLPESPEGSAVRRWMHHVGPHHWRVALRLRLAAARADAVRHPEASGLRHLLHFRSRVSREALAQPPLELKDLAVGGSDLKALGLRPGPRFKDILQHLLDTVLEEPELNHPQELRQQAEAYARREGLLGDESAHPSEGA